MRMKELRDDRVHARMALVRELFGLAEPEIAADDPLAAAEPDRDRPPVSDLAEVRARAQRRR